MLLMTKLYDIIIHQNVMLVTDLQIDALVRGSCVWI
jgi:hypothetical protein